MNTPFDSRVKLAVLEDVCDDNIQASSVDSAMTTAECRNIHADAADKEKLTELKETLAYNVLFFMWLWCGLMFLGVMIYFTSQLSLNKEIPKEVILGMFTATSVVVGLVGYILKGLFGGKE